MICHLIMQISSIDIIFIDYNTEICKRGWIVSICKSLQRIALHIAVSEQIYKKPHLHTHVGITMVDLITVHFLYELIAGLNARGLSAAVNGAKTLLYSGTFQ